MGGAIPERRALDKRRDGGRCPRCDGRKFFCAFRWRGRPDPNDFATAHILFVQAPVDCGVVPRSTTRPPRTRLWRLPLVVKAGIFRLTSAAATASDNARAVSGTSPRRAVSERRHGLEASEGVALLLGLGRLKRLRQRLTGGKYHCQRHQQNPIRYSRQNS